MCAKLYNEALFLPSVPGRVRHTRYRPTATGDSSHAEAMNAAQLNSRASLWQCCVAHSPSDWTGWGRRARPGSNHWVALLLTCIDRLVVRNGRCCLREVTLYDDRTNQCP